MGMTQTDTFDRSCAHWSEAGRAEMDRFYEIATVDYRHLAEARDWAVWLAAHQKAVGDRSLRLLDVACGSGKFPVALQNHGGIAAAALPDIDYALLDPSEFSIREAKAALAPPFQPGAEYQTTVQDLDAPANSFDIAWATHALYAVPPTALKAGLARLLDVVSGEIFIAHAYADAHYLSFQRLFLAAFDRTDETLYTPAEAVIDELKALGAEVEVNDIAYENGAALDQRDAVEGYLQRCVFDETVSLETMEAAPVLTAYLEACRANGAWRFAQRVALITAKL